MFPDRCAEPLCRALLQPECQDCAHPHLSANQLSALFIRLRCTRNARNARHSGDEHAVNVGKPSKSRCWSQSSDVKRCQANLHHNISDISLTYHNHSQPGASVALDVFTIPYHCLASGCGQVHPGTLNIIMWHTRGTNATVVNVIIS